MFPAGKVSICSRQRRRKKSSKMGAAGCHGVVPAETPCVKFEAFKGLPSHKARYVHYHLPDLESKGFSGRDDPEIVQR